MQVFVLVHIHQLSCSAEMTVNLFCHKWLYKSVYTKIGDVCWLNMQEALLLLHYSKILWKMICKYHSKLNCIQNMYVPFCNGLMDAFVYYTFIQIQICLKNQFEWWFYDDVRMSFYHLYIEIFPLCWYTSSECDLILFRLVFAGNKQPKSEGIANLCMPWRVQTFEKWHHMKWY